LVERQRITSDALRVLAAEEAKLRERLRGTHEELYDSILREETQRVVLMLQQDASEQEGVEDSPQTEMVRRVRAMVTSGGTPEAAQKVIVEELVGHSREQVQKRVLDVFLPLRFEAEGQLNMKRLGYVHELEAVEAMVLAFRGGTFCEEAKAMGFEFGLAEHARQTLQGTGAGDGSVSPGSRAAPSKYPSVRSFGVAASYGSSRSLVAGASMDSFGEKVVPIPSQAPSLASVFDNFAADVCESTSGCVTPRSQALYSPSRTRMTPIQSESDFASAVPSFAA